MKARAGPYGSYDKLGDRMTKRTKSKKYLPCKRGRVKTKTYHICYGEIHIFTEGISFWQTSSTVLHQIKGFEFTKWCKQLFNLLRIRGTKKPLVKLIQLYIFKQKQSHFHLPFSPSNDPLGNRLCCMLQVHELYNSYQASDIWLRRTKLELLQTILI